MLTFTNKMQLKDDVNININNTQNPFSATNNLRNEELTEFVEKLIKENCSLKKEIIIKEIEIEKLKEMLKNASIKYYNLETGNINNIDKIYFEKIRNINLENDFKLNQIELKYENELQKIKDEHNKALNDIQNNNKKIVFDNNIDNNYIKNKKTNEKIILDDNKIEEYLQRIKTLEAQLYNSEQSYQLVQKKYDMLIEENKMIKHKIKEEKENILFIIDELQKESNLKKDEIVKEFKDKTNLITQHFISFSENEKAKANLVLENLLNDQKTLNEKIELLEDENAKLSEENNLLIEKTKSNDEFIAQKELEMLSIDTIKQNFSKSLSNYENEIAQLTKENLNLKKKISEMEAQINALLSKNEHLEKSINSQINEINEQNSKLNGDLQSQIIQLEQEKRELHLKYNLNSENEGNMKMKVKDLNTKIEELNKENSNLKFKINEYEVNIQSLNEQIEKMNQNYEKIQQQYANMDKEYSNANNNLAYSKKKFFENEEEIKNLKDNIKMLEVINENNNKELAEIKQLNVNLNHNMDTLKLNYKIEITKYKNKINDYESKIKELTSNNIYTK